MNQKLPKPLYKALARGTGGEAHPSLDALAAFAEQTLPPGESQEVSVHLAQCANCREVLFVASGAVEEGIGIEEELVAAASDGRFVSDRVYAHAAARPAAAPMQVAVPRRSGISMGWAMAAMAAVAIVSSVAVWRFNSFNLRQQPTAAVVSNEQGPGANNPEEKPAPSLPATTGATRGAPAKSERAKTGPPAKENTLASEAAGTRFRPNYPSPSAAAEARAGNQPATPDALGKAKIAFPAPSTRNGFAQSAADSSTTETAAVGGLLAKQQMSARGLSAQPGQWRVSSDGHIEHEMAPGSWTRVQVNQATRFRVAAVVGNDIWAGGSGGALFHSRDGGIRWSPVTVSGETSSIVAIRFDDSQHGTVANSDGSTWSTADGGQSWTKQ